MVIGNGMIAKSFDTYQNEDGYLIFASGVSDSTTTKIDSFEKEKKLLIESLNNSQDKIFVYFSTCSLYDETMKNNAYVCHKIEMENLIKNKHNNYHIFRVSNPIGITANKKTFLNYFIQHIKENTIIELWENSYRNIIDIDDMYAICNYILKKGIYRNQVVNIANPENYSIGFIIDTIENHLKTKGNYIKIKKGSSPTINTDITKEIMNVLGIIIDRNYLEIILNKYFDK